VPFVPYYVFFDEVGADSVNSTILGTSSPPPLPAFEHQDQIFSAAFSILNDAIAARAFPAASTAITHQGRLIALKAFGSLTYKSSSQKLISDAPPFSRSLREEPALSERSESKGGDVEVIPTTLFDIASLTKVVATTTMAMILYQRGLLDLEVSVAAVVPEFVSGSPETKRDSRRQEVTFRMLLAHSSGLPAYEKLYLQVRSRDELLHAAYTTPLTAGPGSRAEYSDIGFILLGAALERIAGESLDIFCQREIFGPLGMISTTFNPTPDLRPHIPPTADEREQEWDAGAPAREMRQAFGTSGASQPSTFRGRIIQGEVQDENASVLGGVAAHAGLFSAAEDLARFAQAMLNGGRPILRPETVALFTRRGSAPAGTSRSLGWDTPSAPSQSGKYFAPVSFGHLGYTGISLWIDPTRQLSITLLTNRTWPDCSNKAIKQVRPRFHDAVIEALQNSA
jgi:CubicO group peptidase (beta-lactamase class C family)